MVPKIIKKHLLSSRVIKSLKDLTQDLDLAYDVSDITPMAIQLRKVIRILKKEKFIMSGSFRAPFETERALVITSILFIKYMIKKTLNLQLSN